jgi:hypothetical protein
VVLVQARPEDGSNAIYALHVNQSPASFQRLWSADRALSLGTYAHPSSRVLVTEGDRLEIRDLASPEVTIQVVGAPAIAVYRAFDTPEGRTYIMGWPRQDFAAPFEVVGLDDTGAFVSRLQPWDTYTALGDVDMVLGPKGQPTVVAIRGGAIVAAIISEDGGRCREVALGSAAGILDKGLEIEVISAAYTSDGFVHALCQVNHAFHVDFRYMRVGLGSPAE